MSKWVKHILLGLVVIATVTLTAASGFPESNINDRFQSKLEAFKKTDLGDGVSSAINPGSKIVFPHIANGGDSELIYVTSLTLGSVELVPITAILKVFDAAGNYLAVELFDSTTGQLVSPLNVGVYHVPIEPLQTVFLETSGSGQLTVGWASARAACENSALCEEGREYRIGGNAAFKLIEESSGDLRSIVGVGASAATPGFCIPVLKHSSLHSNTAFAIINNSSTTTYLEAYLLGNDGAADTTMITLEAGSHMAQYVDELFSSIGSQFYGTLHVLQVDESGEVDPRFDVHPISLLLVSGIMTSIPVTNVIPFEGPPLDGNDGWDPDGKPNLTLYQPSGWSDKMVVSKIAGTNTDSTDLTTQDTLYVDHAVINNGKFGIAVRFHTDLLLDGVFQTRDYHDPPLEPGGWVPRIDYSIGKLSAGTHTITIRVDSLGEIAESSETDNEYTKTITVGGDAAGAYDGTWSGTTEQERPLSFEVENNQVTLVTVDVTVQGTMCTTTITGGVKITPGASITDNSFVWSHADPWGSSTTLSGTFSSSTAASGTLKVTSQTCNGTAEITWSATKN